MRQQPWQRLNVRTEHSWQPSGSTARHRCIVREDSMHIASAHTAMPEHKGPRNQASTIRRQGAIRRRPPRKNSPPGQDAENSIFAYLVKLWNMLNWVLPDVLGRVPAEHRQFVSHLLGVLKICLLLLVGHLLFRIITGW